MEFYNYIYSIAFSSSFGFYMVSKLRMGNKIANQIDHESCVSYLYNFSVEDSAILGTKFLKKKAKFLNIVSYIWCVQ